MLRRALEYIGLAVPPPPKYNTTMLFIRDSDDKIAVAYRDLYTEDGRRWCHDVMWYAGTDDLGGPHTLTEMCKRYNIDPEKVELEYVYRVGGDIALNARYKPKKCDFEDFGFDPDHDGAISSTLIVWCHLEDVNSRSPWLAGRRDRCWQGTLLPSRLVIESHFMIPEVMRVLLTAPEINREYLDNHDYL
jgi:hypothetical protein